MEELVCDCGQTMSKKEILRYFNTCIHVKARYSMLFQVVDKEIKKEARSL